MERTTLLPIAFALILLTTPVASAVGATPSTDAASPTASTYGAASGEELSAPAVQSPRGSSTSGADGVYGSSSTPSESAAEGTGSLLASAAAGQSLTPEIDVTTPCPTVDRPVDFSAGVPTDGRDTPTDRAFQDGFSDGDYTSSPRWTIRTAEGDYTANVVDTPTPEGDSRALAVSETTGGGTSGLISWAQPKRGWDGAWQLRGSFALEDFDASLPYQTHRLQLGRAADGSGDVAAAVPLGNSDGNNNDRPFTIRGSGIEETSTSTSVDWREDVFYTYEFVRFSNGTIHGYVWEAGTSRPAEPMVVAQSTDWEGARSVGIYVNGARGAALEAQHDQIRWTRSTTWGWDSDAAVYSWQVDGEPVDAAGPTLRHTFEESGTHTVTVQSQSDDRAIGPTTRSVQVGGSGEDAPELAVRPSKPVAGESVGFQPCSQTDQNATYEWSFGDGASANGSQVAHTYDENGTYDVSLRTQRDGTTEEVTREVEVAASGLRIESVESEGSGYYLALGDTPVNFTAHVSTTDESVEAVEFDLPFGDPDVDDDGSDGWTTTVKMQKLVGPTPMTVRAVGANGSVSEVQKTIFVIPAPEALQASVQACPTDYVECKFSSKGYVRVQLISPKFDVPVVPFEVNAAAGVQWNPSTASLQALGGGALSASFPVKQAEVAVGGKFAAYGQRDYYFQNQSWGPSSPTKVKGRVFTQARVDIPIPGAWFGAAGLEARLAGKLLVGGDLQIADTSPPSLDTMNVSLGRQIRGTATIRGYPLWIDATICEGGAGGELGLEAQKTLGQSGVTGSSSIAAVAKAECLFATKEFKAVLWTTDFDTTGGGGGAASALRTDRRQQYRVVNQSSTGWQLPERTGRGPGGVTGDGTFRTRSVAAATGTEDGRPVVSSPLGGSDLGRITADGVEDSSPSLTGAGDGYTLVWTRQAKSVEAGKDVYTATYRDGRWSEPTAITDDHRGQFDPEVAGDGDERVAVWSSVDRTYSREELTNDTAPTEVASQLETTVARRTGDGWNATQLTDDDVMDANPSIAHQDGASLVLWERTARPNLSATGQSEFAYTVYRNGTATDIETVRAHDAAISTGEDGFRLARVGNESISVDRIGADGTRTSAVITHDVNRTVDRGSPVTDVDVGPDAVTWTAPGARSPSIAVLRNGGVETLSVGENVTEVREIELHEGAEQDHSLLTYRGREASDTGTQLYYRLHRNGSWVTDHSFASGVAENLTLWQADTATTPDGFQSVYLGQPPTEFDDDGPRPTADLFHTAHSFRPDYELSADVPDPVAPGENATVRYRLSNVGDRSAAGPVSLVTGDDTSSVATIDGSLRPGESTNGTLSVPADGSGTVRLRADAPERIEEHTRQNNRLTLSTGAPDVGVDDVRTRRSNGSLEVTATVSNDGNATAEGRSASLTASGEALRTTSLPPLEVGEMERISFDVPVTDVDRAAIAAVTVDGGVEDDGARSAFRILVPDASVDASRIEFVETADEMVAEVPVANDGTGAATATVVVERGNRTLGRANGSLPAAVEQTTQFRTVSVPLPSDVAGRSVTVRVETDAMDAVPGDNAKRTRVSPVLRPVRAPQIENASLRTTDSVVDNGTTLLVNATVTDPDDDLRSVTADASAFDAGTIELDPTDQEHRFAASVTVDGANATEGRHALTLTARDDARATTNATTNAVLVDTTSPVADLGSNVTAPVDEAVRFDASLSSDAAEIVAYEWDLDGDGSFEYETANATITHEFDTERDRVIRVRVIDTAGHVDTDAVSVSVGSEEFCAAVGDGHACDLDGNGEFRDVNADGILSQTDVVVFFGHQHIPEWDRRTDLFDLDGDGNVGQSDVVALFEDVIQ